MSESGEGAADLVAAIRELTLAVRALTVAVESKGIVASAPSLAPVAAAVATVVAPLVGSGQGPLPAHEAPLESARRVLHDAFLHAGSADGDEAAFEAFIALNHSERTSAPRAIPSLREFAWRQLRKRRLEYLRDPSDPSSFTVARTDPAAPDSRTLSLRLFLNAVGRSPTPITLKRDPAVNGAWRITDSSL